MTTPFTTAEARSYLDALGLPFNDPTPVRDLILSQEDVDDLTPALSETREYGQAVARAKAVLALDAQALAEATTPMAQETAAHAMAIHAAGLQEATTKARTASRLLYLRLPSMMAQGVSSARMGDYSAGHSLHLYLVGQQDLLDQQTPRH